MGVRETQATEMVGALRVSGDIGEGLDKLLTAARHRSQEARGGKAALCEHVQKLSSVHVAADGEFEAGAFANLDAAQVRSLVKRYVTLAGEAALNLSRQKESEEIAQGGKAAAFREAVTLADRYHKVTAARHAQLTAPLDEDELSGSDDDGAGRRRRVRGRTLAEAKAETAAEADAAAKKPVRPRRKAAPRKAAKKAAKRPTTKKG